MGHHDPQAFSPTPEMLEERRAYPRFRVALHGVCSIAGGKDIVCRIDDLSLGGARVDGRVDAEVGVQLVVSMPHIGLLAARVARVEGDDTGIEFTGGAAQRRRLRDYLAFILKIRDDAVAEDRGFDRIVPLRRTAEIKRADGRTHMARIHDVSRSGVALTTTVAMAIGETIFVGSTPAEVVRLFEGGAAARFRAVLAPAFDASIVL